MWAPILFLLFASPIWATAYDYANPILPGWHSDPSCTSTNTTYNNTIFCTASTFLAYPGLPIYASNDLLHWKLASNAFNRRSQIPILQDIPSNTTTGGNFAATLRFRNGEFYLIVTFFVQIGEEVEFKDLVFTSTDPWSDEAWTEPMEFEVVGIDPDIFWDDNDNPDNTESSDMVYVTSTEARQIQHYTLNLHTGQTGPATQLWNGTGAKNPEGPHLYKKDGYYYLLLAEGGTELDHSATIARSRNRTGPWESNPQNPVLTNRNTTEYFQTVGHADLFQTGDGKWWAVALGTRSGPAWRGYPMGRETVLTPVEWVDGWPVARAVRGLMEGPLPTGVKDGLLGEGKGYVNEPDVIDFQPGSTIPKHFVHWRFPKRDAFEISPADSEHANTLRLTPSVSNLTGNASASGEDDAITFIARRQTDTLFTYSIDLDFNPATVNEEAGLTVFLTQAQHIDLGVVLLPSSPETGSNMQLGLRFRVQGRGNLKGPLPATRIAPVPGTWEGPIRLQIQAVNSTHYAFSASSSSVSSGNQQSQSQRIVLGYAEATIVSGGTGPYNGEYSVPFLSTQFGWCKYLADVLVVGALVGTYATSNGGPGNTGSYVGRWRYYGQGQKVDYGDFVPSIPTP